MDSEESIVGVPSPVEGLDGIHVVQVSLHFFAFSFTLFLILIHLPTLPTKKKAGCGDNFTIVVSKDGDCYSWGKNDQVWVFPKE